MNAIFFPRKDYDVEICAHRLGKQMTYTEQTDGIHLNDSYVPYTTMAKARNIKLGCFADVYSPVSDPNGVILSDYKNGKVWFDVYSYTPELATKISTGQVITQQEWNNAYNTELLPNFVAFFSKKPVGLSYSYGNDTFKDYVSQFLGARNSGFNGNTDYGVGYGTPDNMPYSYARFCSKQSTSRWYDQAKNDGTFAEQLQIVSAKIDETILNGGWYNNFTHWHNYYSDGNQQWAETYLNLLQSKNVNGQIYFAGYGEALAYLVFRQIITRAVMYSPVQKRLTQLIIRLETQNALNVNTELLQVPISVKFSLVGTPLAGMNIQSNRPLYSLGNDDYLVEIPFSQFPYAVIEKL